MAFDNCEVGYLPGTARDKELSALRTEIMRHKTLAEDTADCVRRAMNFALDGAYSFEELEGVEKSIMGIKIEKYWLRKFGYPMKKTREKLARLMQEEPGKIIANTLLDTEILGIPVDVKHTIGDNWMIPPEAIGHWLLLFKTNIFTQTVSMGLFKADIEHLTLCGNQDKKKSIRGRSKNMIDWLIVDQPFGETHDETTGLYETLTADNRARQKNFMSSRRAPEIVSLPKLGVFQNEDGSLRFEHEDRERFINALFQNCIEYKKNSSAQSYGTKMETDLLKAMGAKKVSASLEQGDGWHEALNRFEVKVSITDKGEFSFQQIRSWQADYYLLVFCDISAPRLDVLFVPSSAIKEAVAAMGASHGAVLTNASKTTDELEMGLRFVDRDFDPEGKNRDKQRATLVELLKYSAIWCN